MVFWDTLFDFFQQVVGLVRKKYVGSPLGDLNPLSSLSIKTPHEYSTILTTGNIERTPIKSILPAVKLVHLPCHLHSLEGTALRSCFASPREPTAVAAGRQHWQSGGGSVAAAQRRWAIWRRRRQREGGGGSAAEALDAGKIISFSILGEERGFRSPRGEPT